MRARLERYERGEKEWVGPRTWGDVVEKVRSHAIKLRGKEERKYAVAKAKQAEGVTTSTTPWLGTLWSVLLWSLS